MSQISLALARVPEGMNTGRGSVHTGSELQLTLL